MSNCARVTDGVRVYAMIFDDEIVKPKRKIVKQKDPAPTQYFPVLVTRSEFMVLPLLIRRRAVRAMSRKMIAELYQ